MDIEKRVLIKLKLLPYEKQKEVLDFIEFIQRKAKINHPHNNLKGLWADLRVQIGEEDIAEVRREMWGNFPGNDV